jgi:membrane fusion protein (multidrug efflux system)
MLSIAYLVASDNTGMPVKIVKVENHNLTNSFKVFGIVKAGISSNAKVYTQFDGKIVSKYYAVGDYVRKGHLLAKIRTKRAQALEKIKGYSIKDKKILAPISGYIYQDYVFLGSIVNPSITLAKIISNKNKYISLSIPNTYRKYIKTKEQISYVCSDNKYTGIIDKVIPLTNPLNDTFEATSYIKNSDIIYKGTVCDVVVSLKPENVLAINRDALLSKDDKKVVYVVKNAKAKEKIVTIGISTDKYIEIRSGVSVGENVVVLGNYELEDGMKVRVVE